MSFSDELLGFWSKPKRRVFIAQWEQGLKVFQKSIFQHMQIYRFWKSVLADGKKVELRNKKITMIKNV